MQRPRSSSTRPTMAQRLTPGAQEWFYIPCSTASSHSTVQVRVRCSRRFWLETSSLKMTSHTYPMKQKSLWACFLIQTLATDIQCGRRWNIRGCKKALITARILSITASSFLPIKSTWSQSTLKTWIWSLFASCNQLMSSLELKSKAWTMVK